ncbi:GNAT family N-acetyltransferase [Methylomarinum vadi]|uniref:GNAT family N-acetyltransferase n=1 Tax=Methylomarinum vadi TaxID=438855 RepID=UPI000689A497|nr:GNAT family N-acetyltransferase [Methylomarinum vadi]
MPAIYDKPPGIQIIAVRRDEQISVLCELAKEIWQDHYLAIIGQAQVDYMLNNFQSRAAINRQIADGCRYFLLLHGQQWAAYFAVSTIGDGSMKLSKLYVRKPLRGCGLGKKILDYIERECQRQGIAELWLTVNRYNDLAIRFYQRNGFRNSGSLVEDIGEGFIMDDYKMIKTLA